METSFSILILWVGVYADEGVNMGVDMFALVTEVEVAIARNGKKKKSVYTRPQAGGGI